jgi:23S rRNA pseudouridine1911/1915/1917 synthase
VTKHEYQVTAALDGARLDKAAVQLIKGMSRAKVKRAIDEGQVRVNGRRRAKGGLVAKGEVISLEAEEAVDLSAPALPNADLPLSVCFESTAVLVVDKPAGQPTAPIRPNEKTTLANALVARYPELSGVGYSAREPGLLHRLDNDTSGLVVVARTPEAFEVLKVALKEGQLTKSYLLVCASEGLPDEGTIEFPIANHPKDQRRVYPCVHPRDVIRYAPRPASTQYRVITRKGAWALVEANVARALRHQIRAHFAAIEHPLAGDVLYGGAEIPGLGRHALHASRVSYTGADEALRFDVTAQLPEAMAALVGEDAGAART